MERDEGDKDIVMPDAIIISGNIAIWGWFIHKVLLEIRDELVKLNIKDMKNATNKT